MWTTNDSWIASEQLPVRAELKVVRHSDPDYGMTDDEIADRNEFIRCYIMQEFELLMLIPETEPESDFFIGDYQVTDSEYNAFNTHDFQRLLKPFDKYGYAVRKILERVKDLAILHSCINCPEDRSDIQARYEALVDFEFRDRLNSFVSKHRLSGDTAGKLGLKAKISQLNRRILECKKVWERYAPWDM